MFEPESVASTFIVAYDAAWRRGGDALADEWHAALTPLALRVDHIGSTSIPGMAAKRVLDLQVSVADLDAAAPAFRRATGSPRAFSPPPSTTSASTRTSKIRWSTSS